jgi:undecaprenyl-diphosphatase
MERLHGPTLTGVMCRVTALGSWVWLLPVTLLTMAALILLRRLRATLFVGLAVGGAEALQNLAKVVFGRPRPSLFPHLDHVTSAAYPSGHAAVSSALALALAAVLWHTRWRIAVVVGGAAYTLAVSFSRVYLGVHYPSDVLAAWLLSVAWVSLLWLL